MKLLMAATVLTSVMFAAACVDQQATTDTDRDNSNSSDDSSTTADDTAAAPLHSNCGHIVYCSYDDAVDYCYYAQSKTGCTLQQIVDDEESDCDAVCGASACHTNIHVHGCGDGVYPG